MMSERRRQVRCAVYTRKSSEEGLDQAFNSLEAQREACLAYIESQRQEGWRAIDTRYDDGGFSGGTLERPALGQLLVDVEAGRIDTVVVYKVDRLTRSLTDFAKIVEAFEAAGVSFVSVTQQFNTTSSMGRLTLNVLLSFAQFEREVTGERIRDKIAASKRKGMWMGGTVPLGYERRDRQLVVNPEEAERVREIFRAYLDLKCVRRLKADLDHRGIVSKVRTGPNGQASGGKPFSRGALYTILKNRLYRGEIAHRGTVYPGQHPAIVPSDVWEAVQAQLLANNQAKRTGTSVQAPSLLAGLLFDARGTRLTPVHTVRHGKRYRYYVSQALLQGKTSGQGRVGRLPAHEVERHVLRRIGEFLATGHEVLEQLALPCDDAAARQALLLGAKTWMDFGQGPPAQIRAFLLATVRWVRLEATQLQVGLSRSGLRTVLFRGHDGTLVPLNPSTNPDDPEEIVALSLDVALRRCGRVQRLIMPGVASAERTARPNPALIKAVARASVWAEQLLKGEVTSLQALARVNRLDTRYVGRLLRCAFLAPDLVEAILQGRQPPDLTLGRMLDDMPLDWAEQHQAFGSI